MNTSRVLKPDTPEYDILRRASAMLTAKSPNGYTYEPGECYMDYGANIYWTTIICDNGNGFGGFQALSPREWDNLILYDQDLDTFVREYFADKWCVDHK